MEAEEHTSGFLVVFWWFSGGSDIHCVVMVGLLQCHNKEPTLRQLAIGSPEHTKAEIMTGLH